MNSTIKIIIGTLLIIAIAGYGGFRLGQSKSSNNRGQFNMAGSQSARGGLAFRGGSGGTGMIAGDIIKKDNQSLTVQLRDGGSKIIWFATSTEISKMTTGSVEDLLTSRTVTINGTTNADGSIVAKSIQLRPSPLTSR